MILNEITWMEIQDISVHAHNKHGDTEVLSWTSIKLQSDILILFLQTFNVQRSIFSLRPVIGVVL
jgi:hypothetical protein